MTTRQGTSYNNMTNYKDPTPNLTQQMEHLITLVTTLNQRIVALEQGQPQWVQAIILNEQQDQPSRDTNRDDRVLRNVKVEAPSFDVTVDPIKFLDWLSEIEDYFECMDQKMIGMLGWLK